MMKKYILILFLFFFAIGYSNAQQVIEDIGHVSQIGLPITALGISLLKGDKKGSIQLLKSFALESGLVFSLKKIINKKRPNGGKYSFPSGHTAVSFMSSTYLWKRYGWEYGVPATILAAFVGYSRYGIDDPAHYFSDVVAGAIIGIGSSWIFTKSQKSDVQIDVIGDMSFVGLKLQVNLN
jgi:membrane-associated phospholipid phosphatase